MKNIFLAALLSLSFFAQAEQIDRGIYEVLPEVSYRDFLEATHIENNRIYEHYSEVMGRPVQSIASSNPIFNINQKDHMQLQFGKELGKRDRSKIGKTTLHWWPVGVNSVLPGNFFGHPAHLRYRLIVHQKKEYRWVQEAGNTPIILRAFHTNGTGSEQIVGHAGNGLYAWRMNARSKKWSGLPYRYKPSGKCWIVMEDKPISGQVYVRSANGFVELYLGKGNYMLLGAGSVVPGNFLNPATLVSKKYRFMGKGRGFKQVASKINTKLIDLKNGAPVTYVFNPAKSSWTITKPGVVKSAPSGSMSSGGGLSGLVFDILDIADPVQGYHDPNWDPDRSPFNRDGSRSFSREQRNMARFGTPYDPFNLGEKMRWEALYGPIP